MEYIDINFFLLHTFCLPRYVFVHVDEHFVPNSTRNICKKDIFHWQWQCARNMPQLLLSRTQVCAIAQTQCSGEENVTQFNAYLQDPCSLQCGVMSTPCAVCITVKAALVETPNEVNMLKYCNLSHRVLFFKALVIRGFVFMQQMFLIHTKVLQRDWGTYTDSVCSGEGLGRVMSAMKRPITERFGNFFRLCTMALLLIICINRCCAEWLT